MSTVSPKAPAHKITKEKEIDNIRDILSLPSIISIYLGYSLLLFFGLIRQWIDKFLILVRLKSPPFTVSKGYASLFKELEYFWLVRVYQRGRDCFERPISSVAGSWFQVMERYSTNENESFKFTGKSRKTLNLGSYNYLGFAQTSGPVTDGVADSIRTYGVSTSAPYIESGNSKVVRELEDVVAKYVGKPAAMVFGMGYATNSTTIPILAGGKGNLIISDNLNHNSIVAGARDSGARIRVFRHNNPKDLEKVLRDSIVEGQPRTRRPWKKIMIIVEGIYSMEGEICRLPEIVALKKKYKAYLYVDEAHSIGALGANGRGVCEHWGVNPDDIDVLMGTFTKAFGSVGGYLSGSEELIRYLRVNSYSSLYAAAMSPPCAAQALLALKVIIGSTSPSSMQGVIESTEKINDGTQRVQQLHANANYFRSELLRLGFHVFGEKDSPVAPMMVFYSGKLAAFSRMMLERGIAVVVVGFPVVPLVLGRVRFCISAGHTKEDLDFAIAQISEVGDLLFLKYNQGHVQEEEWMGCL